MCPPLRAPPPLVLTGGASAAVQRFQNTLRPYDGNPMRLLLPMSDGKLRTSDLVKCIRAGDVSSQTFSEAIQLPDGFHAQAAAAIQSRWKGRQRRREYMKERQAVIKVQAAMRGKVWRNELGRLNFQAAWIQAVWRGRHNGWRPWMCRPPTRMDQLDAAAMKIQAHALRKQLQREYVKKKAAAVEIQKIVRGRQGRQQHQDWLKGRNGPVHSHHQQPRTPAADSLQTALIFGYGCATMQEALKKNRKRLEVQLESAAALVFSGDMVQAVGAYDKLRRQAADCEVSCG